MKIDKDSGHNTDNAGEVSAIQPKIQMMMIIQKWK